MCKGTEQEMSYRYKNIVGDKSKIEIMIEIAI